MSIVGGIPDKLGNRYEAKWLLRQPETVMVHFARNFVVDLANYTPASAEKGYLSAARYMSPELLSRFEPIARAQLKQVVTNRVSQFFAVDSERVKLKLPGRRASHSPIKARARLRIRSDKYIPDCRSFSSTGRASGIMPLFFAVKTRPRVPRTGIPWLAAQRRAARSSTIITVPGLSLPQAST